MPIGFSAHGSISTKADSSAPSAIVAVVSWDPHDGSKGFTFDFDDAPPVSVPASYYEGEDLQGVTFPPPGSVGPMSLNATIESGSLCNAEFVVKTYGLHTKYLQAIVLPPERTENPLHISWQGTFRDPDGNSERIFAAGYKSGTDAKVKEAGKPEWVVLGEKQLSGSARRLMSGK